MITPLEHVTPHSADAKEKEYMPRWGLDGLCPLLCLFNVELPSPSSNKWLFLAERKVWPKELKSQGGTPLQAARESIATHKLPSKWTYSPHTLLTMLQTTSRYLPATDHRRLYDKIKNFFLMCHKVCLPYRIPIKIPCVTPNCQQ